MKKNNFLKTFLKGEFSYGFWNFVTKLIGAVNSFITISFLTIYEYGSFQLLLASYGGLVILLGIGGEVIRNDILRFEAEGRSADAKKLFYESSSFKIIVGVTLWFLVFFFAPMLSFRFGKDYIFLIKIISFLFLHDAFYSSVKIVIEMGKKFNAIAGRSAIAKFSQLAVLLYYFYFDNVNLKAVVMSVVISSFATLIVLLPTFFDAYKPWRKIKKSADGWMFKILTSYGKWEIIQPITGKITGSIEPWAIKLFISTEAVAIYSIAQTLLGTVAGFFPIKTLSTLVPLEIGNEDKMRKIYTYGVKYLMLLSLVFCLGSFTVVPVFIDLFFNKYMVSLPYFNMLLLTLPIVAISSVSSIFLVVFRRQKFMFFQKILKSLAAIPLYFILLPIFGLWGLVIHNFILSAVMMSSLYLYLKNMKPRLFVNWYDLFIFNEEDNVYLKNIFGDVRGYLSRKFYRK